MQVIFNNNDDSFFFGRCLGLLDLLLDLLGLFAALSLHVLILSLLLSVFLFGHSLEIVDIVFVVIRVQQLVSRVLLLLCGGLIAETSTVAFAR